MKQALLLEWVTKILFFEFLFEQMFIKENVFNGKNEINEQ